MLSEAHVRSGQVMTVLGPVPSGDLGPTLMHEHLLNDCRCWWHRPEQPDRQHLATARVSASILGELRMDPFVCLDNCTLDDEAAAVEELRPAASLGCRTVVDPTCRGIGRDPAALVRIAHETGLNIVMGAGYYLQASHPPEFAALSVQDICDEIVQEAVDGIGGVRIGLVGEIGVSSDFTPAEQRSLQGAARAAARTGLPLMVHLPGWFRHGHRVLDMTEAEGADPAHTVLCHMNPSGADTEYQYGLARRGAFLEYDMVGMNYWYADQAVQCPSDEENAKAIAGLAEAGYLGQVLLSQDVFLKMMLTRHGGFGYAYVQRHFLPRLGRMGLSQAELDRLMIANPRRVFDAAA